MEVGVTLPVLPVFEALSSDQPPSSSFEKRVCEHEWEAAGLQLRPSWLTAPSRSPSHEPVRHPIGGSHGEPARKATGIRKGISPMNRPPLSDKNIERYFPTLKRKTSLLRQNEVQRKPVAVLKRPNQLNRKKNTIPANFTRSGNKLSHQKDTGQSTFLFRRGLKVQAQLNTEQLLDDVVAKRTRQWRTSTTNVGILTVSIDNPGAVQCPVAQKPRLTRTAVPSFLTKREQSDVKKVPKGVPLQFDINSVGKQTGMTLNERFGILKEQRATLTFNKGGSRFVTVG
ncbi:UAP56-interacting factor-like [Alexandromys fortis]|uniref:UAP56-interacting factor-like n=1 Tax=Alexandromys fortis TaxID=100897 RepID=UPI002152C63A|nr:UAP56-interacting factor-like [Microtus fortis]